MEKRNNFDCLKYYWSTTWLLWKPCTELIILFEVYHFHIATQSNREHECFLVFFQQHLNHWNNFETLGRFYFMSMNVKRLTFISRTVSILILSVFLLSAIKEHGSATWTPGCPSEDSSMNSPDYHPLTHVTSHKSLREWRFRRQISAPLTSG